MQRGVRDGRWLAAALLLGIGIGLAADAGAQEGPLGLGQRGSPMITIPIEGPGNNLGDPELIPAFPGIDPFDEPIDFVPVPDSNLAVVIEQDGRLIIFENRPDVQTKSVFLDITDRVSRAGFIDERGLLGVAFDPDYATNGYFYVYYTQTAGNVGPANAGVLERYRRMGNDRLRADPNSGRRLLFVPQPEANHNGGDLAFSPNDGFLYLTLGDGGGANDNHGPTGNAQRLDMLLGSLLRIDPETDADGGYQIPPDNPFGSQKCEAGSSSNGQPCGEIFHFGLRHPWRFSFDSLTGDGWIGDVGQGAEEEVDFFAAGESGINFGWACREGFSPGPKPNLDTCNQPSLVRDPITSFATRQNPSIIGGYVYRGNDVAALQGLYVYSGFNPGTVMVTDRAGNARRLDVETAGLIHGLGEDQNRELYVVYGNGALDRFATAGGSGGGQVPMRLSDTGIFANTTDPVLSGAGGVNPYDVRAKLFSDNLDKRRYLAIPAGRNITFTPTGRWVFPAGSVIVKTFLLGTKRVETRVLVRGADRWRGYTYQWNDAQTDAMLVGDAGATITLDNGELYDLPSRNDCIRCHNDRSNGESQIIGLQTRQVNFDFAYPSGVTTNQLRTLNGVNYFGRNVGTSGQFETFPDYFDPSSGSLSARAKAYLDQNCGFCHRAGGGTPVGIRLEFDEGLESLVDVVPSSGVINGAQLVVDPGNKENSVLWQRMRFAVTDQANRGPAMPPLAHRQIDTFGVQLIGDWIDAMDPNAPALPAPPAPPAPGPAPGPAPAPGTVVGSGLFQEGGFFSAADTLSFTNDGTTNLTMLRIDLSGSAAQAAFNPSRAAFLATSMGVGFDGSFDLDPSSMVLTLRFDDFQPGESFSFQVSLTDGNGFFTTGEDLAGATVSIQHADGSSASGVVEAVPGRRFQASLTLRTEAAPAPPAPAPGVQAVTATFNEGGFLEDFFGITVPDRISFTNTGTANVGAILIGLSSSAAGAAFDPTGVAFEAITDGAGLGAFMLSPDRRILGITFTDFEPGETFTFRADVDDDNGGETPGADFAGAQVLVFLEGGPAAGVFEAGPGPNGATATVSLP